MFGFNYLILINFFPRRSWTALQVTGTLFIKDLQRFQYKVHIFKLQDDSYSFDHFEELFDKGDLIEESISETEWKHNEVRIFICSFHRHLNPSLILFQERSLLPEQTGCVVFCIALDNLQDKIILNVEAFVLYRVMTEGATHNLQLYGGRITLDAKFLGNEKRNEVFPNDPQTSKDFRKLHYVPIDKKR